MGARQLSVGMNGQGRKNQFPIKLICIKSGFTIFDDIKLLGTYILFEKSLEHWSWCWCCKCILHFDQTFHIKKNYKSTSISQRTCNWNLRMYNLQSQKPLCAGKFYVSFQNNLSQLSIVLVRNPRKKKRSSIYKRALSDYFYSNLQPCCSRHSTFSVFCCA